MAQRAGQQAAVHAGPWITALARAGYAAKGVVYLAVAFFALTAAWSGGKAKGSEDALRSLPGGTVGQVLLAVVALGLAGYALWCFVRAILDPEDKGRDLKGAAKRVFAFLKGVVHASLVVAVVEIIAGSARPGDDEAGISRWTARLMSWPLGVWLVGLIGASVVAYGLGQLYRAWAVKLDEQLSLGRMSPAARTWAVRFGRFGMATRGVVFAVVGGFLILAAAHTNPGEAKGLGAALQVLQQQTYGPWLLAAAGLGLGAYGLYELVRARYRRIEPV